MARTLKPAPEHCTHADGQCVAKLPGELCMPALFSFKSGAGEVHECWQHSPLQPAMLKAGPCPPAPTKTSLSGLGDCAVAIGVQHARVALLDIAESERSLACVPRHTLQHLFLAYLAWLGNPNSSIGQEFQRLLQVAPYLQDQMHAHACRALFPNWCQHVQHALQNTEYAACLAATFQDRLATPSRRVLRF